MGEVEGRADEAHRVFAAAVQAAEQYELRPSLLLAVVLAETDMKNIVSYPPTGGCDVGHAQIRLPGENCNRCNIQHVRKVTVNLQESARILALSRRACSHRRLAACRRGQYSLYNSNSLDWSDRVRRREERILQAYGRLHESLAGEPELPSVSGGGRLGRSDRPAECSMLFMRGRGGLSGRL